MKNRRKNETTEFTERYSVFSKEFPLKEITEKINILCPRSSFHVTKKFNEAQALVYLPALNKRVGLLVNFNVVQLKDGIKRLII
jgi:hypothetical protein